MKKAKLKLTIGDLFNIETETDLDIYKYPYAHMYRKAYSLVCDLEFDLKEAEHKDYSLSSYLLNNNINIIFKLEHDLVSFNGSIFNEVFPNTYMLDITRKFTDKNDLLNFVTRIIEYNLLLELTTAGLRKEAMSEVQYQINNIEGFNYGSMLCNKDYASNERLLYMGGLLKNE